MNRKIVISLLCTLVVGLSAVPALAQSPTEAYNSIQPVPHVPASSTTALQANQTRTVHSVKRLPFTGVDVRLVGLGGMLLLGSGWALRRRVRSLTD